MSISPSHPNFFSFANPSSSLLCNEPVTNLSGTPAFISFQWRTLFKVKGNFSREFKIQILQIVTQLRKFGKEKILKFDVTVQWRDYSTQLFNWSIILFSLGQFSLILVLSIKFSLVNVFFHSIKTTKSYLADGGYKKRIWGVCWRWANFYLQNISCFIGSAIQIYQPQNAVNLSLLSLTPNWPLKLLNESQEKSSAKKKDFQSKLNKCDCLYFYIYI